MKGRHMLYAEDMDLEPTAEELDELEAVEDEYEGDGDDEYPEGEYLSLLYFEV